MARRATPGDSRIGRRCVVGGLIGSAAAAVLGKATVAQPVLPEKLRVFLDYDQDELDAAYDQAPWAPNQDEVARRNAERSTAALARLGSPRRLAYGPAEIESLDLYSSGRANAPLNIYIHGGEWRFGNAAASAFRAEVLVDAGAHFVALDFSSVNDTDGDLMPLADQVRRAVAWVFRNATTFGGDPDRIFVSGHSSGGHLAGVVLTTDWAADFGLPSDLVKGCVCASGMYDLYPVSLSKRRDYVRFTAATIESLSPQRHVANVRAPAIVAYGTLETPEFQRQSREFAAALAAAGKRVELVALTGHNHFEVGEAFGNPYSLLGRALLRQMRLGAF